MEGVQPIVDALAEYEEINQKFGLPEYYEDQDKMDKLFSRQAELQDIIDATDDTDFCPVEEREVNVLQYLLVVLLNGFIQPNHRKDNLFIVYCCHVFND